MAFDNNAISVEVIADTGKAEVTLNQFQQSLQTFTANYNQTVNNIYQISEKTRLSLSKLVATIANTGFATSQIKNIITSFANIVNGVIHLGDTMDKTLLQTGISVETLGGLKVCGGTVRRQL